MLEQFVTITLLGGIQMFVPVIYKEANSDIYKINEKCEILRNGVCLKMDLFAYHSVNGYDYIVLLRYDGTAMLYPLDKLIYNSFNPETQNMYEHFKCIHLDGNLRNNNIDNLKVTDDIEEWRIATYPDLPKDRYYVSSWGRIKNVKNNKILKYQHRNAYLYIYLTEKGSMKKIPIHRIVAHEFIRPLTESEIVNHLNSIKCDNYYGNLEIVTELENNRHAAFVNRHSLNYKHYLSEFDNDTIRIICEHLVSNEGNPTKTVNDLKSIGINISKHIISNIKSKVSYSHISDEYFEKDSFKTFNKVINEELAHKVCEYLLRFNGSVMTTFRELIKDGYSIPNSKIVESIKNKCAWIAISDQYFNKDSFEKLNETKLNSDDVHLICKYLLQHNGSVRSVYKQMMDDGISYVTETMIYHIKYKKTWVSISDQYFDKHQFDESGYTIPPNVITKICKYLVDYNGSVKRVMKQLSLDNIDGVSSSQVYCIKYKRAYTDISDEYF